MNNRHEVLLRFRPGTPGHAKGPPPRAVTGRAPTIVAGDRKGPDQVVRASTCTSRSHSGPVLKAIRRDIVRPTGLIVSQIVVAAQQLFGVTAHRRYCRCEPVADEAWTLRAVGLPLGVLRCRRSWAPCTPRGRPVRRDLEGARRPLRHPHSLSGRKLSSCYHGDVGLRVRLGS